MSDTPKTDFVYNKQWNDGKCSTLASLMINHSEVMERERDAALALAESNGKLAHDAQIRAVRYKGERDEAKEQYRLSSVARQLKTERDKMHDALVRLTAWADSGFSEVERDEAVKHAYKALGWKPPKK